MGLNLKENILEEEFILIRKELHKALKDGDYNKHEQLLNELVDIITENEINIPSDC